MTSIFGSSMEVFICVDGESSHRSGRYSYQGSDGTEFQATVGSGDSPRATGGAGGTPGGTPGFHCGSAFATVVSVAGPWPPVAVPVPFRLEANTPAEKLRCEVGAAFRWFHMSCAVRRRQSPAGNSRPTSYPALSTTRPIAVLSHAVE